MKNKLWLICILVVSMFTGACSCDRFDIDTYATAVRNYNNSIGIDYTLTITTQTEGESFYTKEESFNKYSLSTTRVVLNYFSELVRRRTEVSEYGANSSPTKEYELKRYYVGETRKFYTNEFQVNTRDNRVVKENTTYEIENNGKEEYDIKNIVPTFDKENISSFTIVKDENKKGYSIATFQASCPTTTNCDSEIISYTVVIDRNFYFSSIEFTTVYEGTTREYKYVFNNYNSDVEITFPDDLINY